MADLTGPEIQSCQRAENVEPDPHQFFKTEPDPNVNPNLSVSKIPKPEIKKSSLNFEEILMKKMSFTHPQSHQFVTAIFLQGVLFALLQQSRKPYHSLKISIFFKASGPIEALQFFKVQARLEKP